MDYKHSLCLTPTEQPKDGSRRLTNLGIMAVTCPHSHLLIISRPHSGGVRLTVPRRGILPEVGTPPPLLRSLLFLSAKGEAIAHYSTSSAGGRV